MQACYVEREHVDISTHALTEGDPCVAHQSTSSLFQLTPSRRATASNSSRFLSRRISTHALTEGDYHERHEVTNSGISTHALTEGDALGTVSST